VACIPQHEIISGVKFTTKVKRAMFSVNDEIVIGSYAPQVRPTPPPSSQAITTASRPPLPEWAQGCHEHQQLTGRCGLCAWRLSLGGVQSQPHQFEFPRYGWNEAPTGMLSRGRYNAEDKFVDSDGVTHLEYSYPVVIARTWQG
jgi:hypothetical protein